MVNIIFPIKSHIFTSPFCLFIYNNIMILYIVHHLETIISKGEDLRVFLTVQELFKSCRILHTYMLLFYYMV